MLVSKVLCSEGIGVMIGPSFFLFCFWRFRFLLVGRGCLVWGGCFILGSVIVYGWASVCCLLLRVTFLQVVSDGFFVVAVGCFIGVV